jgi:phage shock protein E
MGKGDNNMNRKWTLLFVFILMFFLLVSGCSYQTASVEYKKIDAQEAKSIIDGDKDVIILDVRTEEEYNQGHIPNSVLITDANLKDEIEDKIPNKDAKILVYCRSGRRSAASAKLLIEMGYTNVYDFGGIIDWPYDIIGD